MNTEQFIEKAKKVHGDRYEYSKVIYTKPKEKVCIICKKHGEFWQKPYNHLNGQGCSKCRYENLSSKYKKTTEEFIEEAKMVHGDRYEYSKVDYNLCQDKVTIICPIHGEFEQRPLAHIQGQGCPKCGRKKTKQEIINKALSVFGDKYDYSLFMDDGFTYTSTKDKMPIICKEHGTFYTSINGHINGKRGCPECGKNTIKEKLTMQFEKFKKIANEKHNFKYEYDKNSYENAHTKTKIICPIHGEFKQLPTKHLIGQGCPECYEEHKHEIKTTNISSEEFYKRAIKIHNGKYSYTNDFTNTKEKITIICPIHGEFKQEAQSHLQGHGCPKCACSESKAEIEIYEYVCNLVGGENVVKRDREVLDGKELDIYIPILHIAIEFNGLRWHSEEFNKDKNYHLSKLFKCNEKGIKLIQVFEDEWIERKIVVLKKIKHILGFNNGEKIYARKCDIKILDKHIAYDFLDKNHIQGSAGSTVFFGAFYNDRLIGVMGFNKDSERHWNLTRFATDNDVRCIGVAGKLFKAFLTAYNPKYVKSFADRRWTLSEGNNLYTNLGFKLAKILSPDYRYVNGQKREHKFNYRKQILNKKYGLPLSMTETEMTTQLGFYKIWDCGLYKFEWKKNEEDQ